jgi:hypothetical protein
MIRGFLNGNRLMRDSVRAALLILDLGPFERMSKGHVQLFLLGFPPGNQGYR